MSKPKKQNRSKKLSKKLNKVITKHLLKRIKRRAKVNGFNKAMSMSLAQREASIMRNKQREAAFAQFKLDQLATEKDKSELPQLINDPNLPMETRHALELYLDRLQNRQMTARDKEAFFGPVQSSLLKSVPYEAFNSATKNLAFVNSTRRHR